MTSFKHWKTHQKTNSVVKNIHNKNNNDHQSMKTSEECCIHVVIILITQFPSNLLRVLRFFLQTTELTRIGPLLTETTKTTEAKYGQGKLSPKGPPFIFYFFKVTYKTGRA